MFAGYNLQGWLFYSDSKFWKPPQMKVCLLKVELQQFIVILYFDRHIHLVYPDIEVPISGLIFLDQQKVIF